MVSDSWRGRSPRLLGVLVAGVLLSACSSSEPTPKASPAGAGTVAAGQARATTVGVALKDFGVAPAPASVTAGSVTFSVQNAGAIPHEFVVVKSELAADKLPQIEQKLVDEQAVQVVSKLAPFDPGQKQDLTVTLQAGKYILLCNVASHYISGMYAAFEVTGGAVSDGY